MTVSEKKGWSRKPLGEVANVVSGYAFKSSEFSNKGVPVIKIKNIRVGKVDLSEVDHVDEKFLELPERYHVSFGDVLISLTGSHISQPDSVVGRVSRHGANLPKCLLNQRGGKIILKDRSSCNLNFLYYALSEPETVRAIVLKAHGAANQANVSPSQVESVYVPIPPLPIQDQIAGILSAYDDLIENNQRRITILEEMARSLYREWFVHFRFPRHNNVKIVPSPLGPIPRGWEVKVVREVLARRPAGRVYRETDVESAGAVPVIDQSTSELLGFHANTPDHLATSETPIAIFGDHTCKMQLLVEPFSIGPNVVAFGAKIDRPISYVFYMVRNLVQTHEYKRHWTQLTSKDVVVADKSSANRFAISVQPLLQQTELFRTANRILRHTRDLLLPRLLSGELDVSKFSDRPAEATA